MRRKRVVAMVVVVVVVRVREGVRGKRESRRGHSKRTWYFMLFECVFVFVCLLIQVRVICVTAAVFALVSVLEGRGNKGKKKRERWVQE